jgi:peptidase E
MVNPGEGPPTERIGAQVRQAACLSEARRPKVCLLATAVGDSRDYIERWYGRAAFYGDVELSHVELFVRPNVRDVRKHLLDQDVLFVSGGSVVNLLAVWRAHRVDAIVRECWEAGVVLAGQSAGSLCWHAGGLTDSFGDALDVVDDCLGFLPYSNGVHDDLAEQPRRERFRDAVATGRLPAGYATEDGVGLHYVETRLHEAVSVLPGAKAYSVSPRGSGGFTETVVEPRLWVPEV